MNEENIDDDALLSGLPSWKDSFQPVKRPSEKLVTEKGSEQAQRKSQPSITTVTADDDARMALRMAALKTLKKRKHSANGSQHADSAMSREASCEAQSDVAEQHTTKISTDIKEQRPAIPSSKKLVKHSAGKQLEYTDVDAPENEPEQVAEMVDSRRSRQRISYADEYTAKVEPPSGDIETNPWENRSMKSSVGQKIHTLDSTRKSKSRQVLPSYLEQPGPSRPSATPTQFIQESPWRPLIIDLSDEEDEEDPKDIQATRMISPAPIETNKQSSHETNTLKHYDVKNPDSELSRKEKEIERMLAKIKELEQKKKACLESKSDEASHKMLGKRMNSTDDECNSSSSEYNPATSREALKVCYV